MRPLPLAAAGLVLAAVWVWPRPQALLPPFTGHMTMHMAVVALAAPLLALGLAGGPYDPARRAPGLLQPIPASMVELVLVWGWHTPALHHLARHTGAGLALEQGTFLAAGVLLWGAALGGTTAQRRERATAGVAAMLLTSMHMTLLGALLVLTPRALFDHGHAPGGALTAAQDQHVGGAVMLLFGGLVYLAGGLGLVADAMRHRGARPEAR